MARRRLAPMQHGLLVTSLAASLLIVPSVQMSVSAAGTCAGMPTSLADPLTAGVWQDIMDTRATSGEAPFTWSPNLAQAAAFMAQDAAARVDVASDVDSLGRDTRTRDTDCGYVASAQVTESLSRDLTNDPFNVWTIWKQNDVPRLYPILYSPVLYPPTYTVGALGRYRNSDGVDYWVLNVGTLSDSGGTPPTPTPIPATPTSIPPTSTSVPPTATGVPPTTTKVPATATSVPPTPTGVPPTATSIPPTATSVPPTATSIPPTATSIPPTATSIPPTATPSPTSTLAGAASPTPTPRQHGQGKLH